MYTIVKLGFKHTTYSVVTHNLYTQDTKSPSLPMISLRLIAPKQRCICIVFEILFSIKCTSLQLDMLCLILPLIYAVFVCLFVCLNYINIPVQHMQAT